MEWNGKQVNEILFHCYRKTRRYTVKPTHEKVKLSPRSWMAGKENVVLNFNTVKDDEQLAKSFLLTR